MSDEVIVYGYCDAGCRRRVLPYEEYINAYNVEIYQNGYALKMGKSYRIKNLSVTGKWNTLINVGVEKDDGTFRGVAVTKPDYQDYLDGIKFKITEVFKQNENADISNYIITMIVNGVEQTQSLSNLSNEEANRIFAYVRPEYSSHVLEVVMYDEKAVIGLNQYEKKIAELETRLAALENNA